MEIITLQVGRTEEIDAGFAEGLFSDGDESFRIIAIDNGELSLLVNSDLSLAELMEEACGDEESSACEYEITSWDAESKEVSNQTAELDLESVLAYCMSNEFECYECWRNDGNEGLYSASEADKGLAYVLLYDLLQSNGFQNLREIAENGDEEAQGLLSILEEMNADDAE